MTLGHFLDAAYTTLVEEHRSLPGKDLLSSLEALAEWSAGGEVKGDSPDPEKANLPLAGRSVEAENALALSQLNQMLGGTQFKSGS